MARGDGPQSITFDTRERQTGHGTFARGWRRSRGVIVGPFSSANQPIRRKRRDGVRTLGVGHAHEPFVMSALVLTLHAALGDDSPA